MKKKNLFLSLLAVALLASCGGGNTPTVSSSSEEPIVEPDDFEMITDLEETKEIHTEAMKTYLAYEGEYKTMPEDQYPDGSKSAMTDSNPLKVNLEWDHFVPEDKEVSSYTLTFGQDAELNDGFSVTGLTEKTVDLDNVFLGTNYFRITANYADGTSDESNIREFHVDETAPRNINIDGMTNCRDMGGRILPGGHKIRQGLIYRTSGVKGSNPAKITDTGVATVKEQLGIKTEINVSDSDSANGKDLGWDVINCYMNYNQTSDRENKSTWHHFARNCESIKDVFDVLADESRYPLMYHCRIGTDRTGLVAILVNGLLGVPLNEIYQDYLFSNFGKIQNKRYIGEKAGEDNIENYMQEIAEMPGETWANKTYNTLLAIGVEKEVLDQVIYFLTEGGEDELNNDNGQIVGMGSDLKGGVVKTSTTRDNPAEYFTLAAGDSLTYEFNTESAYDAYLTAYMGLNEFSKEKMLSDAIEVKLDGAALTVAEKNYFTCGFGSVSNRTCYYYNKIGEKNIEAGKHTLTLTSKVANLNVGGVAIFKK